MRSKYVWSVIWLILASQLCFFLVLHTETFDSVTNVCAYSSSIQATCRGPIHTTTNQFLASPTRSICQKYPRDPKREAFLTKWFEKNTLFIASNQFNSEHLIPHFLSQLLEFFELLGPTRMKKVFISIYENGSSDQTAKFLKQFEVLLNINGIPSTIVTDAPYGEMDRIERLVLLRNKALEPLGSVQAKYGFRNPKYVLFLNDIVFCAQDLVELLYQGELQQSDITTGVDVNFDPKTNEFYHYDLWVTRDIEGNVLPARWILESLSLQGHAHYFPKLPPPAPGQLHGNYSYHETTRDRMLRGFPFQVSCSWGGAALLNAKPFLIHFLKFCVVPSVLTTKPAIEQPKDYLEQLKLKMATYKDCEASECSRLCKDFANMGFSKFVAVPRVLTTYSLENYIHNREAFPIDQPFHPEEDTPMEFEKYPTSTLCIPWKRLSGANASVVSKNPIGWEITESPRTC